MTLMSGQEIQSEPIRDIGAIRGQKAGFQSGQNQSVISVQFACGCLRFASAVSDPIRVIGVIRG